MFTERIVWVIWLFDDLPIPLCVRGKIMNMFGEINKGGSNKSLLDIFII